MKELVIAEGVRTPFIKSGTDARDLSAADLGAQVMKALFERAPIKPSDVDELIFGCVAQPFDQANVTRVAQIQAGLPLDIPAYTVHRNCASSMQSVTNACEEILSGRAEVVIAGGMESLSNTPLVYNKAATDFFGKLSRAKTLPAKLAILASFRPAMFFNPRISLMEGLTDPTCGLNMGQTAEILAREFGISRAEQDQFSVDSHLKAAAARKSGRFAREISSVYAPPKFTPISQDNGIREDSSVEKLGKLKAVFEKNNGTVTAGNSSQITDGAVALLITTAERAKALGIKPLARIAGSAYAGLDPRRMGLGPVYSSAKLLKSLGMTMKQMQLFEINEAFAAQVLSCLKAFESDTIAKERLGLDAAPGAIDPKLLNVNGGAVALGHPVGSSGGRLLLTLAHELIERKLERGLATLCVGGGQGAAFVIERTDYTR
jgi:acetyl-CoA C-acetyltransferase/acetyl-CoA acyltransferase